MLTYGVPFSAARYNVRDLAYHVGEMMQVLLFLRGWSRLERRGRPRTRVAHAGARRQARSDRDLAELADLLGNPGRSMVDSVRNALERRDHVRIGAFSAGGLDQISAGGRVVDALEKLLHLDGIDDIGHVIYLSTLCFGRWRSRRATRPRSAPVGPAWIGVLRSHQLVGQGALGRGEGRLDEAYAEDLRERRRKCSRDLRGRETAPGRFLDRADVAAQVGDQIGSIGVARIGENLGDRILAARDLNRPVLETAKATANLRVADDLAAMTIEQLVRSERAEADAGGDRRRD